MALHDHNNVVTVTSLSPLLGIRCLPCLPYWEGAYLLRDVTDWWRGRKYLIIMSSGIALTDKAHGSTTVHHQIYADVAAAQLERLRRKIQVGACY